MEKSLNVCLCIYFLQLQLYIDLPDWSPSFFHDPDTLLLTQVYSCFTFDIYVQDNQTTSIYK